MKRPSFSWFGKLKPRAPKYFRDSFAELKKVTWPSRKETWKLTFAVFLFTIVFTLITLVADFGFEQLAERLYF